MKYKVIIDSTIKDPPQKHELSAALVIANYLHADVTFLRPTAHRTPDFIVREIKWELKSPMGNSSRTIENNMRAARKQSVNIILDLGRIKMHQQQALARLTHFLSKPTQFKRVLVVTRNRRVIEIQ